MEENRSKSKKTLELIVLLIGALGALYGFFSDFLVLYKGIFFKHDIIIFAKTTMYMLGGGLCATSLTFFSIKYFNNDKRIENTKRNIYIIFVFPMIIMFILPQIISFYVHNHIENIHFIKCEKESETGFRYTKYVFAKDIKTCTKYEAYKEKIDLKIKN